MARNAIDAKPATPPDKLLSSPLLLHGKPPVLDVVHSPNVTWAAVRILDSDRAAPMAGARVRVEDAIAFTESAISRGSSLNEPSLRFARSRNSTRGYRLHYPHRSEAPHHTPQCRRRPRVWAAQTRTTDTSTEVRWLFQRSHRVSSR